MDDKLLVGLLIGIPCILAAFIVRIFVNRNNHVARNFFYKLLILGLSIIALVLYYSLI